MQSFPAEPPSYRAPAVFFTILRQKCLVWKAFLQDKKKLATIASVYFSSQESLPNEQFFAFLSFCLFISISTKASHTQVKISGCWNFYGRCNYKYRKCYVKLRPHVFVPDVSGEFHDKGAPGWHQQGEESHQVLARGAVHCTQNGPSSGPKLNQ